MASETLVTISPSTGKPVCTRYGSTDADVARLPGEAAKAFNHFKDTSLADRKGIVRRALDLIVEKKDELAEELTEQMGRPITQTATEISTAVARADYLLNISAECLRDTDGEAQEGFRRFIRKYPVGPILIIFAWNYPYLILVNSLIPALLAGNTVIIKPSPQTPSIADHVQEIFEAAGLPDNVITTLHTGSWEKIERVIQNPDIHLICFTGSVEGGLKVQKAASSRVIPVALELGGKDPAYVRSDVDLAWAAENIVDGAVFNSGQSCCAVERVYVAKEIYEPFWKAVQEVLKGYKLGDPKDRSTNIGPVVSKKSQGTITRHIEYAVAHGALDKTPPNASFENVPTDGFYIRPTLLINVNNNMRVMQEETFGPVIPVMPVANDDEAVELMNDSKFGLTASIWTADIQRGEKLAERVDAGTCFVNRCDFPSPDLAWTGWKDSGRGITLSKFGFEQFVKLKSFHIKEYPK